MPVPQPRPGATPQQFSCRVSTRDGWLVVITYEGGHPDAVRQVVLDADEARRFADLILTAADRLTVPPAAGGVQ